MNSHEDLRVWQDAIDFVDEVYDITPKLPSDERYGLVSQLRRAAVSVPANIAEGAGRDSTKDFLRHLSIAQGSLAEVHTLLVIVRRRGYVQEETVKHLEDRSRQVGRQLTALRRSLRAKLEE